MHFMLEDQNTLLASGSTNAERIKLDKILNHRVFHFTFLKYVAF